MKNFEYIFIYVILCLAQCFVSQTVYLSAYLTLSMLPALVMSLPLKMRPHQTMIIAFFTGFFVDFFTDGMLGLSSIGLVLVALLQKDIVRITNSQNSIGSLLIAYLLFFICYTLFDAAGHRPFSFIVLKIAVSSAASLVFGLLIARRAFSDKAN